MQWLLQEFEDTLKLAETLEHLSIPYSSHKVVPFVGNLVPKPDIDPDKPVILFGSYSLWRYAAANKLHPGVFKIRPFVHELSWQPFMLNGPEAIFLSLQDIPGQLAGDKRDWFLRPVDDSKETPGSVRSAAQIIEMAKAVLTLKKEDIPKGSLRHDSELMLTRPARILTEWRLWVVDDQIVTASLYKQRTRVIYKPQIDDDALAFAKTLVKANPHYAEAYVIDICRTPEGLKLLETNCLNAAGFYAADLQKLVQALERLYPDR
ncbi:MAG: ATP-grasp domain-containing protein [Pseudomonadota bacterium]